MNEKWIPLLDYALKTKLSLSTLRRHIKANKLIYRLENGRYFVLDSNPLPHLQASSDYLGDDEILALQRQIQTLEKGLQKAQKEIVELKTLLAFYEEDKP